MNDSCDNFRLAPAEIAEGWVLLSDAAGWRARDHSLPASGWKIRGTCLELVDPAVADSLNSASTYRNFDLHWEWEIAQGGNSGIKYLAQPGVRDTLQTLPTRISFTAAVLVVVAIVVFWLARPRAPKLASVLSALLLLIASVGFWQSSKLRRQLESNIGNTAVGFEYQMLDDSTHPEGAVPRLRTGALYDLLPATHSLLSRQQAQSRFHASRVVVHDRHVQHWLDGHLVLEYTLDSPELRAAVNHSKFRKDSHFLTATKGILHLQNHQSRVTFRNIRIRDLSSERKPNLRDVK